jgi:hypothetical protein
MDIDGQELAARGHDGDRWKVTRRRDASRGLGRALCDGHAAQEYEITPRPLLFILSSPEITAKALHL